MKYIRSIVRRPLRHSIVYWSILLLISVAVLGKGLMNPSQLSFDDFLVRSDLDTQHYIALEAATNISSSQSAVSPPPRTQTTSIYSVMWLYALPGLDYTSKLNDYNGENKLLTPANLQQMCETEMSLYNQTAFRSYCLTNGNGANGSDTRCSGQEGFFLAYFYKFDFLAQNGDSLRPACSLLSQNYIDARVDVLKQIGVANVFLDNPENPTYVRSLFSLGAPLGDDTPPYENFSTTSADMSDAQSLSYGNLFQGFFDTVFDYYDIHDKPFRTAFDRPRGNSNGAFTLSNNNEKILQVKFYCPKFGNMNTLKYFQYDEILAVGSVICVALVMVCYLGSLFLTLVSILNIALSLPVGVFFYTSIFGIDYFSSIHFLAVYLVIGLGADNVFVLFDAWNQSRTILMLDSKSDDFETKVKRLDFAHHRATSSVLYTALTTMIAFISTAVSPVPPIGTFGIYAAITIFVNYCFLGTIFCSNLMVWEKYASKWSMRCCSTKNISFRLTRQEDLNSLSVPADQTKGVATASTSEDFTEPEKRGIGHTLLRKYVNAVIYTPAGLILIVALLILAILLLAAASKLRTPSQAESNFTNGHMFFVFINQFIALFNTGTPETFTEVQAVFGISGLDRTNIKMYDLEGSQGYPIFDPDFDIAAKASQDFLLNLCDNMSLVPCELETCVDGKLFVPGTFICPMNDLIAYLEQEFPGDPTFVGSGSFLTNQDFLERAQMFLATDAGSEYKLNFGVVDGRFAYLAMSFHIYLPVFQPLQIKQPVIELLHQLTDNITSSAPEPLKSFFFTSFDHAWARAEEGILAGLLSGMLISGITTFFVLILATRDIRGAIFAELTVVCIVANVLGLAYLLGWELGITEAIAGVMVIGLSVDYTIHLGHMLHEARDRLRAESSSNDFLTKDMIEYAVLNMGGTVIAGALTTGAASFVLFFCTLAFFKEMATLLLSTVAFAILYSFGLFIPLCRILGPGRKSVWKEITLGLA